MLAVGLIGSFCTLGAGTGYRGKMDMTKSWTYSLLGGDFKCNYWLGSGSSDNSVQTSLSVRYSESLGSIAHLLTESIESHQLRKGLHAREKDRLLRL